MSNKDPPKNKKYEDSRIKHQISLQIGESLGPDPQSSISTSYDF